MPTGSACPICGSLDLVEFSGRPTARCSGCSALERHRKLARAHLGLLEQGEGQRALEVGPLNQRVFGEFLREHGWQYTAIDQSRRGNPLDPRDTGFVDLEADLCDLTAFAADSIQLLLAQHVIEEIPDYRRAFAEIARVLAPNGTALLEIPHDPARPRSESQPPGAFGNVWRFGADLPDVAREHFGEVDVLSYREGGFRGQLLTCRKLG
ncbi:MAG TPA: methyltransferase domain-containing protein [Solirubrobacteraceae bacterium]|nr:methyltransferase domain-containing protein [Solirubrobacteraceae bacterium]